MRAILWVKTPRKELFTMKKDRSALLTLVALGILSAVLTLLAFTAPFLANWFVTTFHRPVGIVPVILTTFYAILPFAAGVLVCLWKLLCNILSEDVFTETNVRLLRTVGFLLFFATLIFAVAGFFYMPFFLLAVCAAFITLIVRVVKNCFAAAVVLKDENDMTI